MTLTAENVVQYAETLVRQAQASGRVLDYSEASLVVIDELFALSDEHFATTSETQRNIVVFYNGCYLGELMLRLFGGRWQLDENWFDTAVVIPVGEQAIQVRPFEKVWRRVTEGPDGNSLVAYIGALRDRLAVLKAS